jgi:hypothetical protein
MLTRPMFWVAVVLLGAPLVSLLVSYAAGSPPADESNGEEGWPRRWPPPWKPARHGLRDGPARQALRAPAAQQRKPRGLPRTRTP